MQSPIHRDEGIRRPRPGRPMATRAQDPGTVAWLRLEIAPPPRRRVSGRPRPLAVARGAWRGRERNLAVDPVIVAVVVVEAALVAVGILRRVALSLLA